MEALVVDGMFELRGLYLETDLFSEIETKQHKKQKRNIISFIGNALAQPAFTCSNLTIETLEQGVKYVQKLTIKTPERRLLNIIPKQRLLTVLPIRNSFGFGG